MHDAIAALNDAAIRAKNTNVAVNVASLERR